MLRIFKPVETVNDYLERTINLNEAEIRKVASELEFNLLQRLVYDLPNQRKAYDVKPAYYEKLLPLFKVKSITFCMLVEYYNQTTINPNKALIAADYEMNETDFTNFLSVAKEAFKERFDYDRVVRVTREEFDDRTLKAFQNSLRPVNP